MNRPEFPAFMFPASMLQASMLQARTRFPHRLLVQFLCSLAISALAIAAPAAAQAPPPDCGNATGTSSFDSGTQILTCSGNQSPGVSSTNSNVTVENLTSNIAPLPGVAGITLEGSNAVTLNSTLGAFKIITAGFEAHGIDASRQQGVEIIHSGGITATGEGSIGIRARATQGEVSISASGNIVAGHAGADIFAEGGGSIAISHAGNITAGEQSSGIYAAVNLQGGSAILITSRGNINLTGFRAASPLDPAAGIAAFGHSDITIVSTGDITATGEARHGIFATTETGDVSITSAGNISTDGFNASGIHVIGGGHNSVLITSGRISISDSTAAAIFFESNDFGSSILENHGTISGKESGYAVLSTGAAPASIHNYGTITGNIYLTPDGGGSSNDASTFNNMSGAMFNSGEQIELHGSGTLNNRGTMSPGGSGIAATTRIGGNFVQGRTGILALDVDPGGGASDAIVVRGTAALSGTVLPQLLNLNFSSLEFAFTILSASAVTNNGLSVSDTALIDYSLHYPNARDVVLSARVKLSATGLDPNQSAVFEYFRSGATAGLYPGFEAIYLSLINAPDAADISSITDQLYSNAASGTVSSALQFSDALAASLRSCPVADGAYGQLRETSCLWAKPIYRQFNQDKGTSRAQIADDTSGISGGFQTAIGENLWGGLGFSLEESNTDIDNATRVDGTWWQLGASAKWTRGPWKISGSISGGQGDLDTNRSINIPGISVIASSATETGFTAGLARLAYAFGDNSFYVTPMLNAGFAHINIDGFTESGAGALNLQVASASETIFSAGPAVEIGATIVANELTFRPYAKLGVTFLSEDAIATVARFAAASDSIAPFTTQARFDDITADVSAGVQWFSASGINLRLNYDGRFGANSEQHGVDAKLTVNY